jgi:hypothetical protein
VSKGRELNLQVKGKRVLMENRKPVYVRPESDADLMMWARKWKVSYRDVYEAILNTGCLEAGQLKKYVHRDRWIYHPVAGTARAIKAGINLIF